MKLWLRRALVIMLCAVMLFSLLPAGAARAEDPGDLGKRIISSRNIHYRK